MRSGDVIAGRYRLEESVGSGGMGIVWRATDLELRRVVALKQANTGDGEQLRREARIGAGLQHPNVITVFDVVAEAGTRWLVMEYFAARSLAEILRADGTLPPSLAARVGEQVAAALAAMHAEGMVHRDITPGNVLLAEDGTVKLTDLGIAIWAQVTADGQARSQGTPGYIAPEVADGYAATPASDMYSLGVTLSVAVEGVGPTGPGPGVASGTGSPLGDVLSALVSTNPDRRPTAEQARALLLEVASGEEGSRGGVVSGGGDTIRRTRPRLRPAIGLGVVVVLVAGVVFYVSQRESPPEDNNAAGPSPTAQDASARRQTPGLPTSGGRLLYGLGPQANEALTSELVRDAPVRMLTTWYHKPSDLPTLTTWRGSVVADAYAEGLALHLIVANWDVDDPEGPVNTKYGTGCGRPHPLSSDFLRHMRTLARVFAGSAEGPPLYVTVFHGVNVYACSDGDYNSAATKAYYKALQDRYLEVREIFRAEAPNALVALGWHGWQATNDNPEFGAGRSMFGHFADVLDASDFQSVLSWERKDNVQPIRLAVRELGKYGPVMVSAYADKGVPADVVDRDLRTLLSDSSIAELTGSGLFAWNFNSEITFTRGSGGTEDFVKDVVRRTGREAP